VVDVKRLVDAAVSTFGGLDLLVNNAARWARTPVTDPFEKAVSDWGRMMDTNLRGVLLCSRACVPHLVRRGGGNIVNVSTYYVLPARSAQTNPPDTDLYNASKWALNGFTQAWALALREHGIRVNALCMGATDTPMLRGLFDGDPPADFAATWMQPEQIAGQLLDLLREGPEGRSGENIGAWVGVPVELGPRKAPHRAITG
jgi:NAD(P)-dependent dehydrogenase (short-subunit alcohol dehydrogenase family)